jgi:hypothetical protein
MRANVGSRATFTVSAHYAVDLTGIDGNTWRTEARDGGAPYTTRKGGRRRSGMLSRPTQRRAVFTSDQIPKTLVFRPAPHAIWSCI